MQFADYIGIPTAHAVAKPITQFVGKVNQIIINPLIILLFALALLYFLYGTFQFLVNADDAEARETGKNHILWGLVGMLVMFAVFAILKLIQNSVGGSTINIGI